MLCTRKRKLSLKPRAARSNAKRASVLSVRGSQDVSDDSGEVDSESDPDDIDGMVDGVMCEVDALASRVASPAAEIKDSRADVDMELDCVMRSLAVLCYTKPHQSVYCFDMNCAHGWRPPQGYLYTQEGHAVFDNFLRETPKRGFLKNAEERLAVYMANRDYACHGSIAYYNSLNRILWVEEWIKALPVDCDDESGGPAAVGAPESVVSALVPTVFPTVFPTAMSIVMPTVVPTVMSIVMPTVVPTAMSIVMPTVVPTVVEARAVAMKTSDVDGQRQVIPKRIARKFINYFEELHGSIHEFSSAPEVPDELRQFDHVCLLEASIAFIHSYTTRRGLTHSHRFNETTRHMARWVLSSKGHYLGVNHEASLCELVSSIIARSTEILEM
jgi:hypothetical protein